TLLSKGKLGPQVRFRSTAGKPYTASLVLDENHKVRFKFDNDNDANSRNQSAEKLQFDALPIVGTCPLHQTPVYETEKAYACRERLESRGNGKGFRMSKTILGRPISREQVEKLLSKGKTDQLDKFISKRTKKPFSAFLVLQKNGSVQFAFPPRPSKNKKPQKRR
ncbi:MAG: DNA topoisomerase III, partial [Opitutae bacterium]|nr:DNA topoisomerase III [Opitutae bacterium]